MLVNLKQILEDEMCIRDRYNFVSDLLMGNLNRIKIMGYEHKGYVGRLHSVASYYKIDVYKRQAVEWFVRPQAARIF